MNHWVRLSGLPQGNSLRTARSRNCLRPVKCPRQEEPLPFNGSQLAPKCREDLMPSYKAPVEEVLFLLNDVFQIERYNNLPGFTDATPDLVETIVSEAGKFCEEVLQPLNAIGDREGCIRNKDGTVQTPPGFIEAYRAFVDGGWVGLAADPAFGGQGLPYTLAAIINEFASSANMDFAMYPGLSQGAIAAILAHGSEEQRQIFAPKLIGGQWSGTMNLTEPHCGTDLGLLKTKARPNEDGSYSITGQ